MKETFGSRLAKLRKEHGAQQIEVAEAVGIGRPFLSMLESDKKECSVQTLVALAEFYDVPLDYLAGRAVASVQAPQDVAHSQDERLLLQIWRRVNEGERNALMLLLKARIDSDAA